MSAREIANTLGPIPVGPFRFRYGTRPIDDDTIAKLPENLLLKENQPDGALVRRYKSERHHPVPTTRKDHAA